MSIFGPIVMQVISPCSTRCKMRNYEPLNPENLCIPLRQNKPNNFEHSRMPQELVVKLWKILLHCLRNNDSIVEIETWMSGKMGKRDVLRSQVKEKSKTSLFERVIWRMVHCAEIWRPRFIWYPSVVDHWYLSIWKIKQKL